PTLEETFCDDKRNPQISQQLPALQAAGRDRRDLVARRGDGLPLHVCLCTSETNHAVRITLLYRTRNRYCRVYMAACPSSRQQNPYDSIDHGTTSGSGKSKAAGPPEFRLRPWPTRRTKRTAWA